MSLGSRMTVHRQEILFRIRDGAEVRQYVDVGSAVACYDGSKLIV